MATRQAVGRWAAVVAVVFLAATECGSAPVAPAPVNKVEAPAVMSAPVKKAEAPAVTPAAFLPKTVYISNSFQFCK